MKKFLKILFKILLLIAALYIVLTLIAPSIIDKKYNTIRKDTSYKVEEIKKAKIFELR